ncbi:RapZ C-terminal domain-containing protein [Streptomyces antarcticus]|uniref:RapZ C-terminal domain-containing protein n=1 Tax=Streptomyces antarcticus TaxID=2996458 RepID=UPI002D1E45F6|nr:RNase adapter RapZ [Streptomyces sp. H34-AA3]
MAPRLTPKRLKALQNAVAHPKGHIGQLIETTDAGKKIWLTAADEIALEELGYADSIDDCGHIQSTPDPGNVHRGHPHFFSITDTGRQAAADEAQAPSTSATGNPSRSRTTTDKVKTMTATTGTIEIVSFGYLHGTPDDAHLTIDLRHHFRDPHVSPELRYMTAHDAPVRSAVMATPGIKELITATVMQIEAFLAGPSASGRLVRVATGCAGGRHRAGTVALALQATLTGDTATAAELGIASLAQPYADRHLGVSLVHRDLDKPVVER